MRRPDLTLERIRPFAAAWLLGVFLLAAQLTPLVHLATHRNDHSHGSALAAGHDHDGDHHDGRQRGRDDDHDDHHDDAHNHGEPAAPPSSNDHGQASSAHFGLALLEAPPAPFLPLPAGTLARAPGVTLHWSHAPPPAHPPVRGPPRLS